MGLFNLQYDLLKEQSTLKKEGRSKRKPCVLILEDFFLKR